jgi:LPS-assembly protein
MSRTRKILLFALLLPLLLGIRLPAAAQEPQGSSGDQAVSTPESPPEPRKPLAEMSPEERQEFEAWRQEQVVQREVAAKPGPPAGSITFELSFPPEKGGGSAQGWAGSIRYQRDDLAVLADGVEIRFQDIQIRADLIEVDLTEKTVSAFGNVVLDQGPRRLAGASLTFKLESKTGTITNASAYVDPDFYFSGTEITKTGENTYHVEDGSFTSCKEDVPAWSFTLGRADIEVEGYARVRHAAMKIKRVPMLYLPYVLWPVKRDRTSGFLVPNIGYSDRRGGYLGLAYYQVLGQSYDTTFFMDLFTKDYVGLGNEFRYQPTEGTEGKLEAYAIRDPSDNEWRWKANLDHRTTDLPFGLRGVLTVQEFSDFEFFRDFERSVDRNTLRTLDSRGFVSGSWGPHSLNVLLNNRETFINTNSTVTLQRLPEIEYRLRPIRIGKLPLRFGLESSLNYLGVNRSDLLNARYGRADLAPQLTLPLKVAPWLSASLGVGYRWTWYGDSLDAGPPDQQTFSGDSLTRTFPFASAVVVGPSFSKIFDREAGRYEKLKHVIEPRFEYGFLDDFQDQKLIPLFDEIDRFNGASIGRMTLTNRLLAKARPKGEGEEGGGKASGAREILSWELSRRISFDKDQPLQRGSVPVEPGGTGDGVVERQAGPLESLLRYNPSERTNLTAEVNYNTLFSQVQSTALSGTLGLGRNTLGVSWRSNWNAATGKKTSDQVRLGGAFEILPRRLKVQTDLVYNIEQSLLQQQRYIVDYISQCYSLRLEWRQVEFGQERDQDLRFSLTLKNVGTFLDLTN